VVLAEIASLLKRAVRGSDAVIRFGGDEFLIILADASHADAQRVVDRAQACLRDWNQGGHLKGFEMSLSIGVAEWTAGATLDEVLEAADREMYASKPKSRQASLQEQTGTRAKAKATAARAPHGASTTQS
jgi:diguanylate cyclase (GGDEF)-like protein